MLYAFYFKQPIRPRVRIRLSYEEFQDLNALMAEARRDSHSDILYAWSRLVASSAFHYSVVDRHYGLEVAKALERREVEEGGGEHTSEGYFRSKEFRVMMKRLNKAHDNYVKIKEAVTKDKGLGYSLNSMDNNLVNSINLLIAENPKAEMKVAETGTDDIGEKRKKLKEKFFSAEPEPGPREKISLRNLSEEEDEDWAAPVSKKGKGRGKRSTKSQASKAPAKRAKPGRGRKGEKEKPDSSTDSL